MGKPQILDVKFENPDLFHKIIKKQRGKTSAFVNELGLQHGQRNIAWMEAPFWSVSEKYRQSII